MAIYRQLTPTLGQNNPHGHAKNIPAGATISELQKKVAECEAKAKQAPEPVVMSEMVS
jgi:hypothetical protein